MSQSFQNDYGSVAPIVPPQAVHPSGQQQHPQYYAAENGAVSSHPYQHPSHTTQEHAQYHAPSGLQPTTGNMGFAGGANFAPNASLRGDDVMLPGVAKEQVGGRDWLGDPENPLNWPSGKKTIQLAIISLGCFVG